MTAKLSLSFLTLEWIVFSLIVYMDFFYIYKSSIEHIHPNIIIKSMNVQSKT
jgi:hypothetical protein